MSTPWIPASAPTITDAPPIPPRKLAFLLAVGLSLRPLLRPAARRDLGVFLEALGDDTRLERFVAWAREAVEGWRADGEHARRGLAERAIRSDPLHIFRRPERAYRSRVRRR